MNIFNILLFFLFLSALTGCQGSPVDHAKKIGCSTEQTIQSQSDFALANAYGTFVWDELHSIPILPDAFGLLDDDCYSAIDREIANRHLFTLDDWSEIREQKVYLGQNWLVAAAAIGPFREPSPTLLVEGEMDDVKVFQAHGGRCLGNCGDIRCSGYVIVRDRKLIGYDVFQYGKLIEEDLPENCEMILWGTVRRCTGTTKPYLPKSTPDRCLRDGIVITGEDIEGRYRIKSDAFNSFKANLRNAEVFGGDR